MKERSVSVALSVRLSWLGHPRPGCYPAACSVECGLSSTLQMQSRDHPANLRYLHHTIFLVFRQLINFGKEKLDKILSIK